MCWVRVVACISFQVSPPASLPSSPLAQSRVQKSQLQQPMQASGRDWPPHWHCTAVFRHGAAGQLAAFFHSTTGEVVNLVPIHASTRAHAHAPIQSLYLSSNTLTVTVHCRYLL